MLVRLHLCIFYILEKGNPDLMTRPETTNLQEWASLKLCFYLKDHAVIITADTTSLVTKPRPN